MTVYKKEYKKRFNFEGFTVLVHNVYDYHGQFIGFGGRIGRVSGSNILLIWTGNAWTGRKSGLKNGARLLLGEYLEMNRRIRGL